MVAHEHGAWSSWGQSPGPVGVPGEAAYSAAKAGLIGLSDALRGELTSAGVAVTLATLGVVDTAFFERRNLPYERRWPKPMPASVAAAHVLAAVERGRPEVVVPRWLAIPARLHGGAPTLYRTLARRFG